MPLLSFWLVLVASRFMIVAALASANARSLALANPDGALLFSTSNIHGILRRAVNCTTAAPLCLGTSDCCSGICCTTACCVGGSICSGGQCVASAPPPVTPTTTTTTSATTTSATTTATTTPTTTATDTSTLTQSTSTGTSTSSSTITNSTLTTTSVVNGTSLPSTVSSSNTSVPLNQTFVPNATGAITGTATATNGTSSTSSVSQSAFVAYNVTTATDGSVLTLNNYTAYSAVTPSQTSGGTATPLVVQQVPPTETDTPDCQLQYQPPDAWVTSGSSDDSNGGSVPNSNGTSSTTPISLCNNGTKISNVVGSMIKLSFTGVEASLEMVPSVRGAQYSVQFDGEDAITLDSYKANATTCEISIPWTRNGLENIPHNVTVTIKGDSAGSVGGSGQLEFNGIVFKGPQVTATKTSSGTNKWIIIGVSIGGFLILLALAVLIFLCFRKRRLRRQAEVHPVTQEVPPSHSRQTSQPMMSPKYTPSHMRGESSVSSPPSLPASPQMSWRSSYLPGQGQPHAGVPSMPERQASWHDGGFPAGAAYPSYPTVQPVTSTPYAIPVTYATSGNGSPRSSFVQGHARGPSNLSDNRNPFE